MEELQDVALVVIQPVPSQGRLIEHLRVAFGQLLGPALCGDYPATLLHQWGQVVITAVVHVVVAAERTGGAEPTQPELLGVEVDNRVLRLVLVLAVALQAHYGLLHRCHLRLWPRQGAYI